VKKVEMKGETRRDNEKGSTALNYNQALNLKFV
jgi:hypothetical protein